MDDKDAERVKNALLIGAPITDDELVGMSPALGWLVVIAIVVIAAIAIFKTM
jgi:hypothetical protein